MFLDNVQRERGVFMQPQQQVCKMWLAKDVGSSWKFSDRRLLCAQFFIRSSCQVPAVRDEFRGIAGFKGIEEEARNRQGGSHQADLHT